MNLNFKVSKEILIVNAREVENIDFLQVQRQMQPQIFTQLQTRVSVFETIRNVSKIT